MFRDILVYGAGAVGGYLGAMLLKEGDNLTFLCRGKLLQNYAKYGLILRHAGHGDEHFYNIKTTDTPSGKYDLIIITVKSQDTRAAAERCKNHLKAGGVVLSVQNGAENITILEEYFPKMQIACGVITATINKTAPNILNYLTTPYVVLGTAIPGNWCALNPLFSLFKNADIQCEASENIREAIWNKLLWNIAYNPLSALFLAKVGALTGDKHASATLRALCNEVAAVAASNGVIISQEKIEKTLSPDKNIINYGTSAYQDALANKMPEIEGLMGVLVKSEIATPVSDTIYNLCMFKFSRWFHTSPRPTADVLVISGDEVLLIERKNEPLGWAIPGGFMDWGETIEQCAMRELLEETGIAVNKEELTLLGVYSKPNRDPRGHNMATVYVVTLYDKDIVPIAGDDAKNAEFFPLNDLPAMAFDHADIIADYISKFREV